jgi:hypothetical protein
MKKSFTLFESIIVLLLSIIIIYTVLSLKRVIYYTYKQQHNIVLTKIELETTKLFLEKQLQSDIKLEMLSFNSDKLYYNDNLLLENVSLFEKKILSKVIQIELCILNNTVCTTILLRKSDNE